MDLNRAIRQQLQMDEFFTGFVVNRGARHAPAVEPAMVPESQPNGSVGLEAIAARIAACQRCDLASARAHAVPGEGHPQAKITFVGEAPGADEDSQGRPFVGDAGRYLDRIIAACGLGRQDVFIVNVLKCRPPHNREPRPEEIVACLPFLRAQIESIRPKVIVALGAYAARTLLNTHVPISQLRGHWHDYALSDGAVVKVMPTFHPAYLLRNPTSDNRGKVWQDMKAVMAEVGLPIPDSGGSR